MCERSLDIENGKKLNSNHDQINNKYETLSATFNKKYSFTKSCNCEMPRPYNIYKDKIWQFPQLQTLKKELNEVKNQLNSFDLEMWHQHTKYTNRAGFIFGRIKRDYNPELLTQAWIKFYEIAHRFKLIPQSSKNNKRFNSVHLCEAPGAFISSLNHYLKSFHKTIKWDWRASTLNPYYEGNPQCYMINDDRFILNTIDKWNFGADFSGNLMNLKNMEYIIMTFKEQLGNIMLVTCDGSIDCQGDPGEQENLVSSLHYWETFTALHLLEIGGSFVLKMFTLFESDSCCLIFLLWNAFRQIHAFKPVTSKEGNSEMYLICLDYKGYDYIKPWLDHLKKYYERRTPDIAILPFDDICECFLSQLIQCASLFKCYQAAVISRNIFLFHNKDQITRVKKLKDAICKRFFNIYNITAIPTYYEIVGKQNIAKPLSSKNEKQLFEKTFLEKKINARLTSYEKLNVFKHELNQMEINWQYANNIKWFKSVNPNANLDIKYGNGLKRIESSKFCGSRLLQMNNQMFDIVDNEYNLKPFSFTKNSREEFNNLNFDEEYSTIDKDELQIYDFHMIFTMGSFTKTYQKSQDQCFFKIFSILKSIVESNTKNASLIIKGFPILTQFNLGVIYALSHLFEKVGFVKPEGQLFSIILKNFHYSNMKIFKYLEQIYNESHNLSHDKISILAFLNIKDLCAYCPVEENDFYSWLMSTNELMLKENLMESLNIILSIIDSKKYDY